MSGDSLADVGERTMVVVPLESLSVDPAVQRSLDASRVAGLARRFAPQAMGVLTVSLRPDGTRMIVDGQHRHAAAVKVGYEGEVAVLQYEGLDLAAEARLFLALNDARSVSPLDKFKARVLAGDPSAREVQEVLSDMGWRPVQARTPWAVPAIASVEKVHRAGGRPLLSAVFEVVTTAWNGQSASSHAAIVGSLGKFLGWHGERVDRARLARELAEITPMNLVADIRATAEMQRVGMSNAGARILTGVYNRRLRSGRLSDWLNR